MSETENENQDQEEYFQQDSSEFHRGASWKDKWVPSKNLETFLNSTSIILSEASSTDTALTGTINNLSSRVSAIENSLGSISGSVTGLPAQIDANLQDHIEQQLSPIQLEIDFIKNEVLPQLEETRSTIRKVEGFIRDNTSFLVSSVESQGTVRVLQREVESISKRLTSIETDLKRTWDRRVTIFSVLVALVSALAAIYAAFFR